MIQRYNKIEQKL